MPMNTVRIHVIKAYLSILEQQNGTFLPFEGTYGQNILFYMTMRQILLYSFPILLMYVFQIQAQESGWIEKNGYKQQLYKTRIECSFQKS